MEKNDKVWPYYGVSGDKCNIVSYFQEQKLYDRDGINTYEFNVQILKINISKKLQEIIGIDVIRKQLEGAGWKIAETPRDFVDGVKIPKGALKEGAEPNVINEPIYPAYLFERDDKQSIVCYWPTNMEPNKDYWKQLMIAQCLNLLDHDIIKERMENIYSLVGDENKEEDIILLLADLISNEIGIIFSEDEEKLLVLQSFIKMYSLSNSYSENHNSLGSM